MVAWIGLVLVIYEYAITIHHEIQIMLWKRPWNATSILFLCTRWTILFDVLANLIPDSPLVRVKPLFITINAILLSTEHIYVTLDVRVFLQNSCVGISNQTPAVYQL